MKHHTISGQELNATITYVAIDDLEFIGVLLRDKKGSPIDSCAARNRP